MAHYLKGIYQPVNRKKYIGKYPIQYRSSWELPAMQVFDAEPNVLAWASESVSIPYRNPLTGRWSLYIPDFLIIYLDSKATKHCELMEIKPEQQMPEFQGKVSSRTKLMQVINAAKWMAAMAYCTRRNWHFRIVTERELFGFKRKP
jgi:TnsA endonuclease N terminal